ncbi:MAG: hypothetical protein NVSMB9_19780 [Isosphaeraceae bacterium]
MSSDGREGILPPERTLAVALIGVNSSPLVFLVLPFLDPVTAKDMAKKRARCPPEIPVRGFGTIGKVLAFECRSQDQDRAQKLPRVLHSAKRERVIHYQT